MVPCKARGFLTVGLEVRFPVSDSLQKVSRSETRDHGLASS